MRPERIQLEGFGTFRAPTEIDFAGADLFALTGATGAGKSTIIDAMCFALYGVVPRFDNATLVAPVISQGGNEAKVRLDFSVGGRSYAAVRVVRATKTGASTREARLECLDDGEVLAGSETELTPAVEQLLGLTFKHFTTCVVLPQGDFARFLHHKPRDRQDLLVELLDLGVYGRMRELARTREAVAASTRALGAGELARLAFATPERLAELESQLVRLNALQAAVDDAAPRLEQLRAQLELATKEVDQARADVDVLGQVSIPKGTASLSDRASGAARELDAAQAAAEAAADELRDAVAAVEALPARAALDAVAQDRAQLATLAERTAKGRAHLESAAAAVAAAAVAAEAAEAADVAAAEALERARRADRAEEFLALLAVGEPCPICQQEVADVPAHEGGHVAEAEAARQAAAASWRELRTAAADATRDHDRAADLLDGLVRQHDELEGRLVGAADDDQLRADRERLDLAEAAVAEAKGADAAARSRLRAAEQERAAADRAAADAWKAFDAARDAVARFGAPAPGREDLHADWTALVGFAEATAAHVRTQGEAAGVAMAEAEAARRELEDELLARCEDEGLDARVGAAVAVGVAVAAAEADHRAVVDGIARAEELRAAEEAARVAEKVAHDLALHLNADRFEKWVLDETLQRLVVGATAILGELTGGTYSLALDRKTRGFSVIDHANADAERSARTLSGGETFLASLALALALADEVAQLAVGGAARLESIFLDEGFGTLDADTLDTVAGALEELQARGRMVGVVSHVPELAERMPVRFHVTKGSTGSTIVRSET